MNASPPVPSLTRKTLIKVAIRIAMVVAIATVISYLHVRSSLQRQALEQLGEYVEQRGMRESSIPLLAEDNLRLFTQDYARRLSVLGEVDPKVRFAELFRESEDGNIRLREKFFADYSITGVIGKQVDINADFRRRLVVGFEMLARYMAQRGKTASLICM